MLLKYFYDEKLAQASYLVGCVATGEALVVDPSRNVAPFLRLAEQHGLRITHVTETHIHADFVSGSRELAAATGATIYLSDMGDANWKYAYADEPNVILVRDGDSWKVGNIKVDVMHTPGHTPACVSYRIGEAVFVGDTLFMPDYGTARADFPGGDARTLYRSIHRLLALPDATRLYLCHDYKAPGRDHFAWETTVGEEKTRNIHVGGGVDEASFVAMREARDATLAAPVLLLPSLQVNIRAGRLPDPDRDGRRFLRIPLKP